MSSTWVLCTPETPFNHLLPTFKCHWWIDQQDCSLWLMPPESGLLLLPSSSARSSFSSYPIPFTHTPFEISSHWPWCMLLYSLFHCSKCMWKHYRLGAQGSEFNSGFSAFSNHGIEGECFVLSLWPGPGKKLLWYNWLYLGWQWIE